MGTPKLLLQAKARVSDFLARRWTQWPLWALGFLGIVVVFGALVGKDAEQEATHYKEKQDTKVALTRKEVKVLTKENKVLKDSIKVVAPIIAQARKNSDSARVMNRKLVVKIDSLERKILTNESNTDPDANPTFLTGQLSNYTPQADTLPDGQILP